MLNLLFALIILASYELDVWMDWKKITVEKQSPLHGLEATVMLIIYIVLSVAFYGFTWLAVAVVALVLSTRWFYFDIRLNQRRKLPYDYIGKNAVLDKLLRKLPNANKTQYILKLLFITLTILMIWIT